MSSMAAAEPEFSASFAAEPPVGQGAETAAPPAAGGGAGGGAGAGTQLGGGTTRGEGQSMSEVMDELLGGEPAAVPLASLGRASSLIAQSLPAGAADSFLAGIFWWVFTKSPAYLDAIRRLGARDDARPVVVRHAHGTRFNLLLLDPQRADDDSAAIQLDPEVTTLKMAAPDVSRVRLSNVLGKADLADAVGPDTLLVSARELAASAQFSVAVVAAPEEIPTCAVTPSVGMLERGSGDKPVATLGAFFSEDDPVRADTCIATSVDHAVFNSWDDEFTVGGGSVEILARHHETDSCLLRVSSAVLAGRQCVGLKGPLLSVPRKFDPATFDGAKSGLQKVAFLDWDPAIVDPDPGEVVRVYTEARTQGGDSGAALIDGDDFIVGFARGTTGYKAKVHYSYWTYALTVYLAHNLHDRVALGA
jgi:hypothetical protein